MIDPVTSELDPAEMGTRTSYALLNSIIVPRPIAWVSTVSSGGIANLAPHSFFTVSSTDPPIVQFTSVGLKDSLRNVRETGEFVVHIVTRPLAELCNATSTDFPAELGEYAALDLATLPSHRVKPPRLAAAGISLECRSVGERDFGGSVVSFGQVVWISVEDDLLAADGNVDIRALQPVSRLGRDEWGEVGEVFSLRREPYDEWQQRSGP
jgi:flavin reductase (DIM6/NTAB) family NADH-FMN oxidoreductase RutF